MFRVPFVEDSALSEGLRQLFATSLVSDEQYIDNLLWSSDGYKPAVSFKMAHTRDSILLSYVVREKHTRADHHIINSPVYKDSCVEFFIAFNGDDKYYNLEFNSIGTSLVGYGTGNTGRVPVREDLISQIKNEKILEMPNSDPELLIQWELALSIPFRVFEYHHITSLTNQMCSANFFKCGDDLPEPHFLAWNNIDNPIPNFHLPAFFGKVEFS